MTSVTTALERFVDTHSTPTSCNGVSVKSKVLRTKIFVVRSFDEFRHAYDLWYGDSDNDDLMASCAWYAKQYKKLAYVCVRNNVLDGVFFVDNENYCNWWKVPMLQSMDGRTFDYSREPNEYENCVWKNMTLMRELSNSINGTHYQSSQGILAPEHWYANGHIIRVDDTDRNVSEQLGDSYFLTHTKRPSGLVAGASTSTTSSGKCYAPTSNGVCEWLVEMLQELCVTRRVADVDFIVNYRDHPVCSSDGSMAYANDFEIRSTVENNARIVRPLGVCSGVGFDDTPVPNQDDWERLRNSSVGCQQIRTIPWHLKKSVAVFRGSSTGRGVTGDPESPLVNRRMQLARMSVLHPDRIDAGITKWNLRPRVHGGVVHFPDVTREPPLKQHLSYDEQSTYKYIVHVDGHVAAFRLGAELFTDSLILKVDSPWRVWFSHMLKPMVHYVPVAADLSDLLEKIEWCRANDDLCEKIASQARSFAVWNLCRRSLMNHLAAVVNNCTLIHNQTTSVDRGVIASDLLKRNECMYMASTSMLVGNANSGRLTAPRKMFRYPMRYSSATCEAYTLCALHKFMYSKSPVTDVSSVIRHENITPKMTLIACEDGLRFAVKRQASNDEALRGSHVAITYLNMLNRELPTFPYTKAVMFRRSLDDYDIEVYTEYLKGVKSLKSLMANARVHRDLILDVCTQIYVSLRVADERYGFRHNRLYDLDNVMVRRLDEPTSFTVHTRVFGALAFNTRTVVTMVNFDAATAYQANVGSKNISSDWNAFVGAVVSESTELSRGTIEGAVKSDIVSLVERAGGVENNHFDALPVHVLFGMDAVKSIESYASTVHANGVPWSDCGTFDSSNVECLRCASELFMALSAVIKMAHEYRAPERVTITLMSIYNQYRREVKSLQAVDFDTLTEDRMTYSQLAHCWGTPLFCAKGSS
ncbi:104.6 Tyrosine protein kinase/Liposaccharide-modifying enzyme [Spodoptera frugiperda ascovirus 1a]|uniref:104.6 Tyrosine protein kinase/Liposaccharide-modifying enzyme n=1 Tax=Spodoptera frugiperda ascovirus 1a TaxID=113370 RepID=Q0E511_SFAVA|nr:104.6 Tyrosine protein kinase/Liposaccharide-modifying enzyme [Spodoptera frugiperda ascovirus 1a]CAL44690.1 104.6 Tyrosine protein kinase/Liposaccharide-modifying enzyme [Spodoptera frugiperda ascovirus 1a]